MSSGGSRSSGTTSNSPWYGQAGHLQELYKRGQELSLDPREFYEGSTVAARDPYTEAALSGQGQRGLQGSPLTRSAQQQTQSTVEGKYLDANPHIDATYDKAASKVTEAYQRATLPGLESRFEASGRQNSGAYEGARRISQDQLGDDLSDLATDIYGQNYARERGLQTAAAARAPQLAREDYVDYSAAQQAGLAREQYAQRGVDEQVRRHEFAQDEPRERLSEYQTIIGHAIPGQSRQRGSQSQYNVGAGDAAGAAGTIMAIASLL